MSNINLSNIKNMTEAFATIEILQNLVLKLEKENSEMKVVNNRLTQIEKKSRDLIDEKTLMEKELNEVKQENNKLITQVKDLQSEMDLKIKQLKRDDQSQEEYINMKLQTVTALEKIKEAQQKDILLLKQEYIILQESSKEDIRKQKLEHKIKFDELKKSMLEKIKNKDRNVSQVNIEHIDVSTKLTILQNHQLLIELEYQSQQIQDLIMKKEALERRLFELDKDLEIHKEVENVLAEKNKKLAVTLKNYVNGEKGKDIIGKSNFFNSENNEGSLLLSAQSNSAQLAKKKLVDTGIIGSLETKVKKLEKQLNNKQLEMETSRLNYINLKNQMEKYSEKSKMLLKLFEEELIKVIEKEDIVNNNEVFLNLNDLQNSNFNYDKLNSNSKYALLVYLVDYLLDILNISTEKETKEGKELEFPVLTKLKQRNMEIKFQKDLYENKSDTKYMNMPFDNKNRLVGNQNKKGKLPNISSSNDMNKLLLGKNFTVLNS